MVEKAMATHSRILAWKIPRTEEPGGQQSMGSHRVAHGWLTEHSTHGIPYTRGVYVPCLDPFLY